MAAPRSYVCAPSAVAVGNRLVFLAAAGWPALRALDPVASAVAGEDGAKVLAKVVAALVRGRSALFRPYRPGRLDVRDGRGDSEERSFENRHVGVGARGAGWKARWPLW